jgi:hypothetical protein
MLHVDERSSRDWMRAGGHMLGTGRAWETQLQALLRIRIRDPESGMNI